jgi:hypothetical protein
LRGLDEAPKTEAPAPELNDEKKDPGVCFVMNASVELFDSAPKPPLLLPNPNVGFDSVLAASLPPNVGFASAFSSPSLAVVASATLTMLQNNQSDIANKQRALN